MKIRLLTQQGDHKPGDVVTVVRVVPHGGNYDCEKQYVLADDTHVPSDRAVLLTGAEWVRYMLDCQRANDAVDALVRILWTVVPLAAAEQRGRDFMSRVLTGQGGRSER